MSKLVAVLGGVILAMLLVQDGVAQTPLDATVAPYVDAIFAADLTPGLAVAVVVDGRLAWTTTRGVADLDSGREVDDDTQFYIASTSKALLGLAAARLAVRGELPLSTTLAERLPTLRMPEGIDAHDVDLRALLTHSHGIGPRGPVSVLMSFSGDYTNALILEALGAHTASPRGRSFQYSNLGYELAGIMLDPGTTHGYKQVVEREVLQPLGMHDTTAMVSAIAPERMALPHEMGTERFERIELGKADANMGPAGGHFSTASDLARLIVAMLHEGRIDDRPAIEPEAVRLALEQQVEQDREVAFVHRTGWGVGWDLGEVGGETIVHRHGGFSGYRCHVSFLPERGLGVVVLTNGGGVSSSATDVLAMAIYDRLLGHEDTQTVFEERLADLVAGAERARAENVEDAAVRAQRQAPLPHPLAQYVGRYRDPLWGTLELTLIDGALQARLGVATSAVEVYDAANDQLRVALLMGGEVISPEFADAEGPATAMGYLDGHFVRE